jgi:hypothetical protein
VTAMLPGGELAGEQTIETLEGCCLRRVHPAAEAVVSSSGSLALGPNDGGWFLTEAELSVFGQ